MNMSSHPSQSSQAKGRRSRGRIAIGHALLELGDGYRKSAAHWLRRAQSFDRKKTRLVWISIKRALQGGTK